MPKTPRVVALLTDFGVGDHYVGVMKGILLSISPNVRIIDLSHEVSPQSIQEAAYLLWASYPHLPANTIVLAVVDPGVGTSRHILLVQTKRNVFIAPDNGALDLVLWQEKPAKVIVLNEGSRFVDSILPRKRSTTFHGRDVLAPICAHVANGTPISRFGKKRVQKTVREPFVIRAKSSVEPRLLHVDRFGNMITNILQPQAAKKRIVQAIAIGERIVDRWINAYEEAPTGMPCLIVGSSGLVEIVMNRASAASFLDSSHDTSIKLIV